MQINISCSEISLTFTITFTLIFGFCVINIDFFNFMRYNYYDKLLAVL